MILDSANSLRPDKTFRNVDNPDCPRRRIDTANVNRPMPRSHKRRLRTLLAIRCQNNPASGRSGLGMAVVFLEGGLSPIPMLMADTTLHRGPGRRVCQFSHYRTQRLANPKHNSLLNLDFLGSRDTVRLKDNQKQLPKTNNDNCQKLRMEPGDPESRAARSWRPGPKATMLVPGTFSEGPGREGLLLAQNSHSSATQPSATWPPASLRYHVSWSSSVLASCRTGVSKPSVNQP
jgi:hypothetical protein